MSEHTTSSAIGRTMLSYCKKCGRNTRHRIDRVAVGSNAEKPGPCLEHSAPQFSQRQVRENKQRQRLRMFPSLFGDRP